MSTNEEFSTEALSELEKQVSKQLEISENELEQVMQENSALLSEYEKSTARLHEIFSNPEEDRLVEEELRRLESEMGVSSDTHERESRELERQIEYMPDRSDIEDIEIQQLLNEIDNEQAQVRKDRSGDVSTLLTVHSDLADKVVEKSSNTQEIEQLTNFSKGAKELSSTIDKAISKKQTGKNSDKKNSDRFLSAIGEGIKKLYTSLKSGVSSVVDVVKKLGMQLKQAITSLFTKAPKKQNLEFSKAINETRKEVEKRHPDKKGINAAKSILKKNFLKLQQDYAKIVPEERKAVFKKWCEKKNANLDKMSMKELYKEVQKIRKGILSQKRKNLLAKQPQNLKQTSRKSYSSGVGLG